MAGAQYVRVRAQCVHSNKMVHSRAVFAREKLAFRENNEVKKLTNTDDKAPSTPPQKR